MRTVPSQISRADSRELSRSAAWAFISFFLSFIHVKYSVHLKEIEIGWIFDPKI